MVESISLLRLLATLAFTLLAFKEDRVTLAFFIYAFAMATDLIDGYLSRKLGVETYLGRVLDLVADKSLTTVSLLYAATRGVDLFPLAVIATRDLMMIGLRLVIVEGKQLLPTNRFLGGIMALLLWGNTLALLLGARDGRFLGIANTVYWVCAFVFTSNLGVRVYASWDRIMISLTRSASSGNDVVVSQPTPLVRAKAKASDAR